ncbi:MAG: hypothetical protein QXH20_06855 [Candidatus Bathyarchaeia archaeon]
MCPDFPRVSAVVDPAVIWTYSTRTLTGFTGQARIDLIGADESLDAHGYTSARASRLDNLDVAVSTRSTLTASEVWGHATRTLTGLSGQPRIDLLGEDASFEAGSGARKLAIDRLVSMEIWDAPIEGSVAMDGTEKDVVLDEPSGNPSRFLEGYIDLSPMASGDTVVIRQYMKISAAGGYVKYAEETYSGAQSLPLLYIVTKPAKYGIKITAQQTAGTNRTFTYQFFRRRV